MTSVQGKGHAAILVKNEDKNLAECCHAVTEGTVSSLYYVPTLLKTEIFSYQIFKRYVCLLLTLSFIIKE